MTKRVWVLISIAAVLGGSYVCFFTGLFSSTPLLITYQLRAAPPVTSAQPGSRRRRPPNVLASAGLYPVLFDMSQDVPATSIQVFNAGDLDTSKYAQPLWHLVADDPAKPEKVKAFLYGDRIRGMKPATEGAKPGVLEAGVTYRLVIEAPDLKGTLDFRTKEIQTAPQR